MAKAKKAKSKIVIPTEVFIRVRPTQYWDEEKRKYLLKPSTSVISKCEIDLSTASEVYKYRLLGPVTVKVE